MRISSFIVAGLILTIAACAPPAPSVDVAAETEALRARAAEYNAAVETFDGSALGGFYADDARSMPPNEGTLVGPAAMAEYVEHAGSIEGFAVTLDDPEVVVAVGGDVGYTVGGVQVTAPGPDGEPVTENGRDVHIWHKDADGTWKIIVDIWNLETPLPHAEQ